MLRSAAAGPVVSDELHARQGKVQVSVSAFEPARRKTLQVGALAGVDRDVDAGAEAEDMGVGGEEGAQDLAVRRRRDRLHQRRVAHVVGEVAAGEVDQEAGRARAAALPAAPSARGATRKVATARPPGVSA